MKKMGRREGEGGRRQGRTKEWFFTHKQAKERGKREEGKGISGLRM